MSFFQRMFFPTSRYNPPVVVPGAEMPIYFRTAGGWPSTTNGCAPPVQVEYAINDVDLWVADFDPASIEYMQFSLALPSDWDGGTATGKFYWLADSVSTNSAVWVLQGRSYGDGEAVDQAWGTAQQIVDANTGQNQKNISAATPAITLAGTPAGLEHVHLRCYRNAIHGSDNLAADARLLGIMVTFTRT